MSENKAASRYAKSLVDLSTEQNALEAVKQDMVLLAQVIDESSALEAILNNPIVPLDKKAGILADVFGSRVHAITNAFLKLIVSKGRSAIVFGTAKSFVRQYNAIKGIVTVDVTSATELTDANRAQITDIVKRETGAVDITVREKIDSKLIGGFVLKVGDKQFDASISSGLNKLKKEFAQGIV